MRRSQKVFFKAASRLDVNPAALLIGVGKWDEESAKTKKSACRGVHCFLLTLSPDSRPRLRGEL